MTITDDEISDSTVTSTESTESETESESEYQSISSQLSNENVANKRDMKNRTGSVSSSKKTREYPNQISKENDHSVSLYSDLLKIIKKVDKNEHCEAYLDVKQTKEVLKQFGERINFEIVIPNEFFKSFYFALPEVLDKFNNPDATSSTISNTYFSLLRILYFHVQDEKEALSDVYNSEFNKKGYEGIPNHSRFYDDYNREKSELLKSLAVKETNESTLINETARRFGFLFILDPKQTLRDVLSYSVRNKQLVPTILSVLQKNPSLIRLKISNMHCDDETETIQHTLLVHELRRLINDTDYSEEVLADVGYLILAFCRSRVKEPEVPGGRKIVVQQPVLDATIMFKDVLFEQLVRAARPHFIFGILTKMFMHQKERHYFINWELSEAESENDNSPPITPSVLFLILILEFIEENPSNSKFISSIVDLMRTFSFKLKEDEVTFSREDSKLFTHKIQRFHWTLQFYFIQTFRPFGIASTQISLPQSIFKYLNPEQTSNFVIDDTNAEKQVSDEDFIFSLFEFGALSSEAAIKFVEDCLQKISVDSVTIAKAFLKLWDLNDELSARSLNNSKPLISKIIEVHNVRFDAYFASKMGIGHSELEDLPLSTTKGQLLPLLTVCIFYEALVIYMAEYYSNVPFDYNVCNNLGRQLLSIFSETAKACLSDHREKFWQDRQNFNRRRPSTERRDENEEKENLNPWLRVIRGFADNLEAKMQNPPLYFQLLRKTIEDHEKFYDSFFDKKLPNPPRKNFPQNQHQYKNNYAGQNAKYRNNATNRNWNNRGPRPDGNRNNSKFEMK